MRANRHYIGYEIDEAYAQLAQKRIDDFLLESGTPELFDFQENKKTHHRGTEDTEKAGKRENGKTRK